MDITSLVETIGNNIVQFQPTIQGVVSAVLTTLFLRKNTNISEFEKMKAGKYSEALDDLLENGKITYFELYKCQNFLKIAKIADCLLYTSWSLKDLAIVGIIILFSVFAFAYAGVWFPLVIAGAYAFLTIQVEDTTIMDFIRYACAYFFMDQQQYEWRYTPDE